MVVVVVVGNAAHVPVLCGTVVVSGLELVSHGSGVVVVVVVVDPIVMQEFW